MVRILTIGLVLAVFCGTGLGIDPNHFTVFGRMAVTGIAVTEEPFDEMPLAGAGVRTGLTPRLSVEAALSAGRWSDYLGMFGGNYNFKLVRLGGGIYYTLWPQEPRLLSLGAGVRLLYHFLRVNNELGNSYEGDLKSHLAVVPGLVLDFCPFFQSTGLLRRLVFMGTLEYPVNGGFSSLTGLVGVGIRIH
jgi:hypothetical protein